MSACVESRPCRAVPLAVVLRLLAEMAAHCLWHTAERC